MLDRHQFGHQFIIDVQAAACIQHDKIVALLLATRNSTLANTHHVGARGIDLIEPMHINLKITPDAGQLIARRRATRVGRHKQHTLSLTLE